MSCQTCLTDDFVLNNTSVSWRTNKYKVYRESLLFDIEKSRFPETQNLAEALKKHPLNTTGILLRTLLLLAKNISSSGPVAKKPKNNVIMACITTDCNGFLNNDYTCGICDVIVCVDCHEKKVDAHLCDKNTVESIKALKAEAKSCPKCATLISKIDGCDQMWCTQCHVTFSWRTGRVENGHTHNPHYYEWMRKNGGLPRAPGDVGACGFPGLDDIYAALPDYRNTIVYDGHAQVKKSRNAIIFEIILNIHRNILHNEDIRARLTITPPDNMDLRAAYMCGGHLKEKEFKKTIQKRDKAYRKSLAKSHIYQMTHTVAGDIFRKLLDDKNLLDAMAALDTLTEYSNNCLTKVEQAYTCSIEKYHVVIPVDNELEETAEMRSLLLQAELGDTNAMVYLGDIYNKQENFVWDPYLATKWYNEAADKGNFSAMNKLGIKYENLRDHVKAYAWSLKAAMGGCTESMLRISFHYIRGLAIDIDIDIGLQWLKKAAKGGNAMAMCQLGWYYYEGKIISKNFENAFALFHMASKAGSAQATFNIGWFYDIGKDIPQAYDLALKWYNKAAEKGHGDATNNIGHKYEMGHGVKSCRETAMIWYKKAAGLGNTIAEHNVYRLSQLMRVPSS